MWIECPCGGVIKDNSDGLPNKAYLLADQDWSVILDAAKPGKPPIVDVGPRTREVYQCVQCGRLTFDDPVTGEMLWFAPENDPRGRALGSIDGNAFKVRLVGRWRPHGNIGDLHWRTSGDLDGGFEQFEDRAGLERRYHEVLAMLRGQGRLTEAELFDGDTRRHRWRA